MHNWGFIGEEDDGNGDDASAAGIGSIENGGGVHCAHAWRRPCAVR